MATSLVGRVDRIIRILLLLLAAAAVLAILLVARTGRPEPLLLSPNALNAQAANLPDMDSMQGGALIANPLFWASRRPYNAPIEEVEIAQPTGPAAIDNIRLVGIVSSGVEASAAIVTIRGQRQRLSLGEQVDGWELVTIEPTTATFASSDRNGRSIERTLSLEVSRASATATRPSR